jgi:CTP synthase (UTP-ammonia lyase)
MSDAKLTIVEIPEHPYFAATLFVPQARSEPGRPHPLLMAFARAASRSHRLAGSERA